MGATFGANGPTSNYKTCEVILCVLKNIRQNTEKNNVQKRKINPVDTSQWSWKVFWDNKKPKKLG